MSQTIIFEDLTTKGRVIGKAAVTVYLGNDKWLWIKKQRFLLEDLNVELEIQPGFKCDKATYPFLYRIGADVDKSGKSNEYSGLHDALYKAKGILNKNTRHVIAFDRRTGKQIDLTLTRRICDLIAIEHMRSFPEDFTPWQITQRRIGIRIGGGRYWNADPLPEKEYFSPYAAEQIQMEISAEIQRKYNY